jgi:Tol biopolymer transport system component
MTAPADRLTSALADRYRVERELGAGGMATVYLAEDLKHQRQVAIKVLKPELAAVLGAERFIQEITTTAQLQHPHILPLFDSGTADGFLFYVMPYIEGETLRDKLNRETQLSVDEAVRITREVADALDYAHRHGVIHRDIKPENVLLHDGRPMVADFGIALAVSAAAGGRMTETGMSLGTPHYMSPEQATADKEITGRADVYSLASVLYEMLTGDPPHTGSSAQQIIVKIIADEARPVGEVRKSVPANVAAAVGMALEKLPADRFDSAKAFADALTDPAFRHGAGAGKGTSADAAGAVRPRQRDPVFLAVGGVAGIAVIAVAGLLWSSGHAPVGRAGPAVYDVGLPDSAPLAVTYEQPFTVAPDGSFLVYQAGVKGGSALWYRSLRDATTRRIDGTDQGRVPAISPDGSRVAFLRFRSPPKWTLEVVSVSGGATTTLADGSSEANLQWLEDGRIQVVEGDGTHARWVDPGGGPTTEHQVTYCMLPAPLSDSNRTLCGGGGDIWAYTTAFHDTTTNDEILRTDSPDSTRVFGSDFHVVDGRYLVYLSVGGDLLAAPVDLSNGQVGRSVRLVTGLDRSAYVGAGSFSLSRSGTLVYAQGVNRAVGNMVATDGRSFDTLNVGRDAFHLWSVSPDGRRLAVVVDGLQGNELRIYDLRSGDHQVWARHFTIRQPVWSPGGDRLLFTVEDSIFVGDPDRAEGPSLMTVEPGQFEAFTWRSENQVAGGLWETHTAVSLDPTSTPVAWDTLATNASFPVVSPDGRWLAYNDVSLSTLWLGPMPPTGERYQVATGSVAEPEWRSDHELVFAAFDSATSLDRATLDFSGGVPVATRSRWVSEPGYVETAGQSYQVMPDGRDLYVRSEEDEPKRYLRVVPNWVAQMKRAVDEANR